MKKSIYFKAIQWNERFEEVVGSYYDFVASIHSPSQLKEKEICDELIADGWVEIKTNNGILVFEKERHVIRIYQVWKLK